MMAKSSNKSKCTKCKRYIPSHLRRTFCCECSHIFHAKCTNNTFSPLCNWRCPKCLQHELPFNSIDDDSFKLTLGALFEQGNLNLKLLPSINIRTLLDKITGEVNLFSEVRLNKTSSKYYDAHEFSLRNFDVDSSFGVLHINIASLSKNFEELTIFLKLLQYNFKVIGISETRITDASCDTKIVELDNYCFVHTSTLTRAGGAGLYNHSSLNNNYKVRRDLSLQMESGFESVFIEITQKGTKNIICGCIYKHPSLSPASFLDQCFVNILQKTSREDKFLIIMGDYNIDLLAYDRFVSSNDFYDVAVSYGLQPLIMQPSRVTLRSQTLIDNIFTNNTKYNSESGNLTCSISDHFAQFSIFTDYCTKKTKNTIKPSYGRCYKSFNENEFLEELSNIKWMSLLEQVTNPNTITSIILESVTDVLNVMAPYRKLSKKEVITQQKPWITKDIIKTMKLRDELQKQYMLEANQQARVEAHNKYKKQRSSVVSMVRGSKISFYKQYFLEHKTNAKKTWDGINSILRQNKKTRFLPTSAIDRNGNMATSAGNIATVFNDYFASVGKSLDDKIPKTKVNFKKYMPFYNNQSLFLKPTDSYEVNNIINSLSASSACGLNSIPTKLLKLGALVLSEPISHMINQSFKEGIFPNMLKVAKVIPVYKSGSSDVCSNYRPISLLSNISKILEKTMHIRVCEFLERLNVIYEKQFGFRKNHSTNHALLNLVTSVSDILDNGDYACGLFLDLQKAFDTVNQSIILDKLDIYGIRGVCRNWFSSYLRGRKQFVAIDHDKSDVTNIECGVPQGSILGPLLFLIYINDFRNCLSSGTAQHYADDTVILYTERSIKRLRSTMNRDIANVCDWLCANRLSLNAGKTEVLLFHPKNKPCDSRFTLKIKSKKIFISNKVKYLGVILDAHLSWRSHLSELSKTLSRANGLLSRIRYYVDLNTLTSLYHSLFHSHMTYGSLAWGLACKTEVTRILKLQQQAIRIITFTDYKEPTSSLFSQLGILKLEDVIKINFFLFMHDWYHKRLPDVFNNFFHYKLCTKKTRAGDISKLLLPVRRTEKYGTHNIKHQGAVMFNELLNLNISASKSKVAFKKEIKGLLIAGYA